MPTFRPGARDASATAALYALTTWLAAHSVLHVDAPLATKLALAVFAAALAPALRARRAAPTLALEAGGLAVASPDGARTIPWTDVVRITPEARALPASRGALQLRYARVDLAHGAPLCFGDLSALAPRRASTSATDAPTILDLADPELAFAHIASRLGDAAPAAPHPAPATARSRLPGSLVGLCRAGVAALAVVLFAQALWHAPAPECASALAGLAAVFATSAAVRWALVRRVGDTGASVAALAVPLVAAALCTLAPLRAPLARLASDYALAAALVLALPVAPAPGGRVVRALAVALADRPWLLYVATAVAGLLAMNRLAQEHLLLPVALLAGCAEALEALSAARRAPPAPYERPADLAALRALLRAAPAGEDPARARSLDLARLHRAARDRRAGPLRAWHAALLVAALAIALPLARHVARDADARFAAAVRVVTD